MNALRLEEWNMEIDEKFDWPLIIALYLEKGDWPSELSPRWKNRRGRELSNVNCTTRCSVGKGRGEDLSHIYLIRIDRQ